MSIVFKLSPNQVQSFKSLLVHDKEFGGVLNIRNNLLFNATKEIGGDYSVRYNRKNHNYEYSYHTHAYYPKMKNKSKTTIMKTIQNTLPIDTNKALYLFECDIMQIHPPSPQDCYVCSLGMKEGMLVFTQEGIYQTYYTGLHPLTTETKEIIDKMYYKYIWGKSKKVVTSALSSGNVNRIIKCLKNVLEYRKRVKESQCISKYLSYLKKHDIICTLIPWNKAHSHVFFSTK